MGRAIGGLQVHLIGVDFGLAGGRYPGEAPGHTGTVYAVAGAVNALLFLASVLAHELMVLGRAAFGVLGEAVVAQRGESLTRVLYRDDPYGVEYTVAVWELS